DIRGRAASGRLVDHPRRRTLPSHLLIHRARLRHPWPDAEGRPAHRSRAGLAARNDPRMARAKTSPWRCADSGIPVATSNAPYDQRTAGLYDGTAAPAHLRCAPALRCRIGPYFDQGGACGAAGPASAPGLSLEEARPAHAGPHLAGHADQARSYVTRTGTA